MPGRSTSTLGFILGMISSSVQVVVLSRELRSCSAPVDVIFGACESVVVHHGASFPLGLTPLCMSHSVS